MTSTREKVRRIIDEELKNAGISVRWDMREIHVLPNSQIVIELTSAPGTISEALIDHHFPPIKDEVELAHYTSLTSGKSILNSGELRLYSILKRLSQQEFHTFSEAHGLQGYLENKDGEPYYITLMRDLFYTSFTDPNFQDQQQMWNVFGDGGAGVKLVLKVQVIKKRSELRPILYHSASKSPETVIKQLSDRIFDECSRHFIMRGISRIGAFYLPLGLGLKQENETRLLIKAWDCGPARNLMIGTEENAYIPLTLCENKNKFCKIELVEVQTGPKCDREELNEIVKQAGWSNRIRITHSV